jgi:hypothetical protein
MTLHNPAQLSAETIGEGYRLLTTGELTKLPDDAEFMGGGEWLASAFRGQDSSAWSKEYTYRTRTAHPTPEPMNDYTLEQRLEMALAAVRAQREGKKWEYLSKFDQGWVCCNIQSAECLKQYIVGDFLVRPCPEPK